MAVDLAIAAILYCVGLMVFGHFETHTPLPKRLSKLAMFFGITALLSATVGRPWSLLFVFGLLGVGIAFHIWWTTRNGIGVISAEPREKYYALRGWK